MSSSSSSYQPGSRWDENKSPRDDSEDRRHNRDGSRYTSPSQRNRGRENEYGRGYAMGLGFGNYDYGRGHRKIIPLPEPGLEPVSSSNESRPRPEPQRPRSPVSDRKWWKKPEKESDYGVSEYRNTLHKAKLLTFKCIACNVTLSSIEARNSHEGGDPHRLAMNRRGYDDTEFDDQEVIRIIPNPLALKKKDPTFLKDKVISAKDPTVGLKFIREYVAETDYEIEPYYKCTLCDCEGEANSMFNHVQGRRHRERFFDVAERSLTSAELARRANKRAENNQPFLIKTIKGDESFPWPAGKAPWSIEKGGTGMAPPGAIERGGDMKKTNDDGMRLGPVPLLPTVEGMGEVNETSVDLFMDLGGEVSKRLKEFYDDRGRNDPLSRMLAKKLETAVQELAIRLEKKWVY